MKVLFIIALLSVGAVRACFTPCSAQFPNFRFKNIATDENVNAGNFQANVLHNNTEAGSPSGGIFRYNVRINENFPQDNFWIPSAGAIRIPITLEHRLRKDVGTATLFSSQNGDFSYDCNEAASRAFGTLTMIVDASSDPQVYADFEGATPHKLYFQKKIHGYDGKVNSFTRTGFSDQNEQGLGLWGSDGWNGNEYVDYKWGADFLFPVECAPGFNPGPNPGPLPCFCQGNDPMCNNEVAYNTVESGKTVNVWGSDTVVLAFT